MCKSLYNISTPRKVWTGGWQPAQTFSMIFTNSELEDYVKNHTCAVEFVKRLDCKPEHCSNVPGNDNNSEVNK